jgi:outer membrane protein
MKRELVAALFAAAAVAWSTAAEAQEPLTLAKALELGRTRAPEIAAARAQAAGAAADASAARAAYLPSVSASINGQGQAVRDMQATAPTFTRLGPNVTYTTSGTGSVALRWTVYDFGKTSSSVDAADRATDAAEARVDGSVVSVLRDVATAYVTLAYREELKNMVGVTVAQRERLLVLAKALVKAGLQPQVEELRATSRLEAARRELAGAETDAQDSRVFFTTFLGVDPGVRVVTPRLPAGDVDAARAAKLAEARRETIRASRANVEANRAAATAARRRYLPTLSLNGDGSYRFAETDRAGAFMTNTRTAVGLVVLSVPVFDAAIPAAVDGADADEAVAEAQLAQTIRDARSDAARAAVAVRGALSSVEHARKAADAAAIVFGVVKERYAQGLASPVELIDAESTDAQARIARTNAEMAQALGVVRLLVATGQSQKLVDGGPP